MPAAALFDKIDFFEYFVENSGQDKSSDLLFPRRVISGQGWQRADWALTGYPTSFCTALQMFKGFPGAGRFEVVGLNAPRRSNSIDSR